MQKGKLKEDIKSVVVKCRIYGCNGDEVTVISDCGNVLIVEDKIGGRWPVKKDLVEIKQVLKNDE